MMISKSSNRAVMDVYDEYRTAKFLEKCYDGKLTCLKRLNFLIEIIIGVFATNSAIAGLSVWNIPIGKDIWEITIALAAILSLIVKPLA